MNYFTILPTILTLLAASPTTALPKPQLEDINTRATGLPGGVYTCSLPNWAGYCNWLPPSSDCRPIGTSSLPIGSLGPDTGGSCVLWENADCTGNAVAMVAYPGLKDGVPKFKGAQCYKAA